MKKELIKLARHYGFSSKLLHQNAFEHSEKEKIRYYLWMCELQKWFKDRNGIIVEIQFDEEDYEEALEELLIDSFELI